MKKIPLGVLARYSNEDVALITDGQRVDEDVVLVRFSTWTDVWAKAKNRWRQITAIPNETRVIEEVLTCY